RQRSNTQITTEAENIEILLGATILSPGGINVSLGFQGNDYGIRASVGKKDDLKGIQLNFCRNLIKQKYFESNFSIGMGYTTESVDRKSYFYWDNEQKYQQSILYLGMFLNIHVSVLFAEIGWTTNVVGVDPAPHFRYQLGCIYIFK
ncbi:MAG: hypothetical protein KAH48_04720, partial [Chlorobi bacterium]|nr:hypothetical protein [Chlorobiota bacterium]